MVNFSRILIPTIKAIKAEKIRINLMAHFHLIRNQFKKYHINDSKENKQKTNYVFYKTVI